MLSSVRWLSPERVGALSRSWRCIYAIVEGVEYCVTARPLHKRVRHHLKHAFIPHKGNEYHPHVLRSHHLIGHAAAFTALKIAVVLFASLIPSEAFLAPDVLAEQGDRIIALTNQVRSEQGLPTLDRSAVLVRSSTARADDMATKEYFSHVSPAGLRLKDFLGQAGYDYSAAGENLAMGFSDAEGVMRGWMKSPTHYANLVDSSFEQIGVGVVGGMYHEKPTVFVAQHFGLPLKDAPVDDSPVPTSPTLPEPVREHPVPTPTAPEQLALSSHPTVAGVNVHTTVVASAPSQARELIQPVSLVATSTAVVPALSQPASSTAAGIHQITATAGIKHASVWSMDATHSFIGWEELPAGGVRLQVQARLTGDIYTAQVRVQSYTIDLRSNGSGMYEGILTIPESTSELFEAIVPGVIQVTLQDGRSAEEFIDWKDPKISSETPWERYVQAKSWLSHGIPVFTLVRWAFLIGGGFFVLALLLNIAGEFRKQHPKVMVQAAALVALLLLYARW